ncbi:acyl-CoA synthetase [Nocardioides alcanivorans]|uniref:acyl-CoA synthetase n=1 Tax=Nocardioides alcanivorans TaxID=2897352 RepID=UPI001F470F77|nr:acyl-CoA synthetase [Nocardioides alcanivorans]
MFPGTHAESTPEKTAVVMADGRTLTYRELDESSARLAQYWWSEGIRPDDRVAVLAENCAEYFTVVWAALRSGLHLTPVNWHFSSVEVAHVIADSGARSVVVSTRFAPLLAEALADVDGCADRLVFGGDHAGFDRYEQILARMPAERLVDEPRGDFMMYTSGTTGHPKGVKRDLSGRDVRNPRQPYLVPLLGLDQQTVTMTPAPLYHAAPLFLSIATQVAGGTVVCPDAFDPEQSLVLIERHRVTHSQWVPTHFHRLLALPQEVRERYDVSSLRVASHTAAPCPPHLKRAMIDWWGPVLHEYYGGSEGVGMTYCTSPEWLAHPGTVGRPIVGQVHVCDDDGRELDAGEIGLIYFEPPGAALNYHNDDAKTRSVSHPAHPSWSTLGDIGHVDEDGYLYLSDRATFMIISGGVNIYPQETENALLEHASVRDAAVFGVPHEEMGEEVVALVELADDAKGSAALASEMIEFVRARIAHYKAPRRVQFVTDLPRTPTGKLLKREVRESYLAGEG